MTQLALKEPRSLDVAPVTSATALMEVISKAAADPTIDVEKLERLMALYERTEARQAKQAFDEAMNEAQTEMRPIAADASNAQTKSKYASYWHWIGRCGQSTQSMDFRSAMTLVKERQRITFAYFAMRPIVRVTATHITSICLPMAREPKAAM